MDGGLTRITVTDGVLSHNQSPLATCSSNVAVVAHAAARAVPCAPTVASIGGHCGIDGPRRNIGQRYDHCKGEGGEVGQKRPPLHDGKKGKKSCWRSRWASSAPASAKLLVLKQLHRGCERGSNHTHICAVICTNECRAKTGPARVSLPYG